MLRVLSFGKLNTFYKRKGSMVSDILCILVILVVVFALLISSSQYQAAIEAKKGIERVVDAFQYIAESNGGLSVEQRNSLIDAIEDINGVIDGSVKLSGSAIENYPVAFNTLMELKVEAKCTIERLEFGGLFIVQKKKYEGVAKVERDILSKGIY